MAHSNKYLLSIIVDLIKVILPDSHSHHSEISQSKSRLRDVLQNYREKNAATAPDSLPCNGYDCMDHIWCLHHNKCKSVVMANGADTAWDDGAIPDAASQTRQEGRWTPQGYVGTADAPEPPVTPPGAPVADAPDWSQKAKEAQEEWAKWRAHDAAVIAAGHPQVEPTEVPVVDAQIPSHYREQMAKELLAAWASFNSWPPISSLELPWVSGMPTHEALGVSSDDALRVTVRAAVEAGAPNARVREPAEKEGDFVPHIRIPDRY